MSDRIKVKHLSVVGTRQSYINACKLLGLDKDRVPPQYIDLAAITARILLDTFIEENNLELPPESFSDSLDRLQEAGVISEADAESFREALADQGIDPADPEERQQSMSVYATGKNPSA